MLKIENDCVGCPPERGCLGEACMYRNVPHYYCDECGDEFEPEELYDYDDTMVCTDCLLNHFYTVAQDPDKWYM